MVYHGPRWPSCVISRCGTNILFTLSAALNGELHATSHKSPATSYTISYKPQSYKLPATRYRQARHELPVGDFEEHEAQGAVPRRQLREDVDDQGGDLYITGHLSLVTCSS